MAHRFSIIPFTLAAGLAAASTATALAQDDTPQGRDPFACTERRVETFSGPRTITTCPPVAGSILIGQVAFNQMDWGRAYDEYRNLAHYDSRNPAILERLIASAFMDGKGKETRILSNYIENNVRPGAYGRIVAATLAAQAGDADMTADILAKIEEIPGDEVSYFGTLLNYHFITELSLRELRDEKIDARALYSGALQAAVDDITAQQRAAGADGDYIRSYVAYGRLVRGAAEILLDPQNYGAARDMAQVYRDEGKPQPAMMRILSIPPTQRTADDVRLLIDEARKLEEGKGPDTPAPQP